MAKLTLYHGTRKSSLDRILKEGLLPRIATKHPGNYVEDHLKSHDTLVYLTSHYAVFYGLIAIGESDEDIAIIRVNVDSRTLFPDEDILKAILKLPNNAKSPHPCNYKDAWELSLRRLGTVSTKMVRPMQITGHVVIPQLIPELPFWLQWLGAESSNVGIAMSIGLEHFAKFKTRTELLFSGGIPAVLKDIEQEQDARRAMFEELPKLKK